MRRSLSTLLALWLVAGAVPAQAQTPQTHPPYQIEWVYRVRLGYEDEWWKIVQKYQLATLDHEKQLGFVKDYLVERAGEHMPEDARWTYRIVITYPDYYGSTHEGEVEHQLWPDQTDLQKAEQRRWDLTLYHWYIPIRTIDPHK